MAQKNLYTNPINEFIDWISGNSSIDPVESIDTEKTPISGGSIRQLIQSHLRTPFYVFKDDVKHRKLLFSSENSYNKWQAAINNNGGDEKTLSQNIKNLVLLEFDIPAPHKLYIKKDTLGENGGHTLGTINFLEGSANAGILSFVYYLDSLENSTYAACRIYITVTDPNNVVTYKSPPIDKGAEWCDGKHEVNIDLSEYLKTGANTISISINTTDGTSADPVDMSITMNLVSFNIDLEFDSSRNFSKPFTFGENISFNVISTKSLSTSVTEKIYVYVDDFSQLATNGPIERSGWSSGYDSKKVTLSNNYRIPTLNDGDELQYKHKVLVYANITDGDINFDSNYIYFEFENAAQEIGGINNHYINIFTSIPAGTLETDEYGNKCLIATQYNNYDLRWGYYTDTQGTNTNPNVTWKLVIPDTSIAGQEYKEIIISSLAAESGKESESLSFVPDTPYAEEKHAKLVATIIEDGNEVVIFENPIVIKESIYQMSFDEHKGYVLKLNAYGRSNYEADTKSQWTFEGYNTIFSNHFPWDTNNGWNDNSLTLNGVENFATVNFNPFPTNLSQGNTIPEGGMAIEIDFMPTNVSSESDVLVRIGYEGLGGCIKVFPSKTSLFVGNSEVLTTNYKSNERIQLMFIFMPTNTNNINDPNAGNIYIVNNGILERAVGGVAYSNLPNDNGTIKFGGSNSGIKIYNIRVWRRSMTIFEAFKNYLYDCDNKGVIIARNTMMDDSGTTISYDACQSKIDTFLIKGNLENILNAGKSKEDSESAVDIEYKSVDDPDYLSWDAYDIKIRKHGQSTLNYPLTSLKFWLNKTKGDLTPRVNFKQQYASNEYVKNRYTLRRGSIPSNKFVLQANYADSSGVHNGGLLRLINDSWYNANFGTDENPKYLLRTAPQLFTSGQVVVHNDTNLNEDGSWVEGYGNTNKVFGGLTANEHTWPELAKAFTESSTKPVFPYKIRIAPDSKPCAVFYQKSINTPKTYLGQFVFMDDKKSDHIYGERSIYMWKNIYDPFCMTNIGANTSVKNSDGKQKNGYDRDANCVWDNKNVLKVECVLINTALTSFMDFNVAESIEYYTSTDEKNGLIPDGKAVGDPKTDGTGNCPADTVKYTYDKNVGADVPTNYYWEDYFELIFPDDEDIKDDDAENGLNKFSGRYKTPGETEFEPNTSKFIKKTQPWIDFLHWICSIGQLNKHNGTPYIDGTTTAEAQAKFEAEAAQHLDLYKVAAYYIFYIRFGLVDSVERNAEFKTYDGQHWFFEPWDMDIALGNKNTGGLVYNPPLNRDSRMPGKQNVWAYSGRSTSTSNILWDCLENWDYWMEVIVPNVADKLFLNGLTYNNVVKMFDEEYANKWSEVLYNYSGMYKYVTAAQEAGWLAWLQGSRTSHRHWWLSTSMNYYDSKWTCGQFNQSRLYLAVNKAQGDPITISLYPTSETYFKLTQKDTITNLGLKLAQPGVGTTYDLTNNTFTAKDPTHIFGVLFLEKLDLGKFASGIEKMIFQNAVDPVLGATIKELNIGSDIPTTDTFIGGWVNGGDISITNTASIDDYENVTNSDALENIETINITGQLQISDTNIITNNRTKLKNIYAAGSGFTTLKSAKNGNKFNILQLPAHNYPIQHDNTTITDEEAACITSFDLTDTSWNDISFWDCRYTANSGWVITGHHTEIDPNTGNEISVADKTYIEQTVEYNKLNYIPKEFRSITFNGSTATYPCSARFILDWFDSIEHYVRQEHPELTVAGKEDELEEAVLAVIRTKYVHMYNIRWNYNISPILNDQPNPEFIEITYKDVIRLGNLNNGINPISGVSNNAGGTNFTGYIKISGEQMETWQLAELIKYFGESVFTISNINNGLVIDQQREYAQISVSGPSVKLINNEIEADENTPIKLRCTSFLLSTENANAYTWTVDPNIPNANKGLIGNNSYYQIIMPESGRTSKYDVTITATNKTTNRSSILTIHINPVNMCRDWKFKWVDGAEHMPRKYLMDDQFARNLFGANYMYNTINGVNTLRDTYILYRPGMINELYLEPQEDINNNSAQIDKITFAFMQIPIPNSNPTSYYLELSDNVNNGIVGYWEANQLCDNTAPIILEGSQTIDPIIKVNKNAEQYVTQGTGINTNIIHNGISFETVNGNNSTSQFTDKAADMKIFQLKATVWYKSSSITEQDYYCNIVLFDDATPIISTNYGSGNCIANKLRNDYPNSYDNNTFALYKTDLISLKDTLSFATAIADVNDVQKLETSNNISLFDFMPNVEIIDLSGTKYQFKSINYFDFTKLKSLRILKLSNATGVTTITTTDHNRIEEIWLDGTEINLHAENNNSLRIIKLGNPTNVYIDLGIGNTVFDVANSSFDAQDPNGEGSSHLQSLDIINNSTTNTYAYKLFDKIYNPIEPVQEEPEESGETGE